MKTQHTPGPWKVGKKNRIETASKLVLIGENEITSRPLNALYESNEERDANARLIAAAPELLHAVKHALKLSESTLEEYLDIGEEEDGANVSAERSNIALFKAAIAKAESD